MYTVYEDRDNTIGVQLVKDGVKLTSSQMDDITDVGVIISGTEYLSSENSDFADTTSRKTEGVLVLQLGALLNAPLRDTKAEIIIYDATNTNGIVWDTIDIKVVDVG